jgi:hypothetical protein
MALCTRRSTRGNEAGGPAPHQPQNTAKLPAAVRKLQSMPGFVHKSSSCRKVEIQDAPYRKKRTKEVSEEKQEADSENQESVDTHYRFLGEVPGLHSLFEEATVCQNCRRGSLELNFVMVGIATEIHAKCNKCSHWSSTGTAKTSLPTGENNQERAYSHSANCLFVSAMMLSGDGGTEAKTLLGLLDLPSSASIEKSTYPLLEHDICSVVIEYTKEILKQSLDEEVRLWAEDVPSFDYGAWKNASDKNLPFPFQQIMPAIVVTYDMGWQKRSSGKRYDSHSGHAAAIGCKTRKP